MSPDGETLLTSGRDGFVRLWNAKDGKKAAELAAGDDALAVAFAPHGKSFLVGDLHGVAKEYDFATRKVTREFNVKELYRATAFRRLAASASWRSTRPARRSSPRGVSPIHLFEMPGTKA